MDSCTDTVAMVAVVNGNYCAGSFKVHITEQLGVICIENIAYGHQFVHCSEDSFITECVRCCYW